MTVKEFSDTFDIMLTRLVPQVGASLDEYEKSVLLTKAQEEVVKGLYLGTYNGNSYEETEELRRSLDCLVRTENPHLMNRDLPGPGRHSVNYLLPDDVWFITYETADFEEGPYCSDKTSAKVVPMRLDQWNTVKDNPFRGPSKRKVIRLDVGPNLVELHTDYVISNYTIKYIAKPRPIILVDLTNEGLSIDGYTDVMDCELNPILHKPILDIAIQFVKSGVPTKTEK